MENCAFGYQSYLSRASLESTDFLPNFPIQNLENPWGAASLSARSQNKSLSFVIRINNGQFVPFRCISLHKTNLTKNATIECQIRNNDNNIDNAYIRTSSEDNNQVIMLYDQEKWGNNVKITISDNNNPDNLISLGQIYIGNLWQPIRNYSTQSTISKNINEQITNSLNGIQFVAPRFTQRSSSIIHDSLGTNEILNIHDMIEASASDQNILFIPDPSDSINLAKTSILGRITASALSNPYGVSDRHSLTITIDERL